MVKERRMNRALSSLLLLVCVGHGLLLLSSGVFLDGWGIYFNQANHTYAAMKESFFSYGVPLVYYLHRALSVPHFVVAYKVGAFASILTLAAAIWAVLRRHGRFSDEDAGFAAAVIVLWPPFQLAVDLIYFPYLLLPAAFAIGCLLALEAQRPELGVVKATLARIAAIALLGAAFSIKSLIVLYLVLLGLYFLEDRRRVLMKLDFVVLPFVIWIVHSHWFPTVGFQAGYNGFVSPARMAVTALRFIRFTALWLPSELCRFALENFWPVLVITLSLRFARRRAPAAAPDAPPPSKLLLAAAATAVGGSFAYIVVGKAPIMYDWELRHALLLGLPIALLLLYGFRFIPNNTAVGWLRASVIAVLLATSVSAQIRWQAKQVRNESVVSNLRALAPPKDVTVFVVRDERETHDEPLSEAHDFTGLIALAWGDRSRIGIRNESDLARQGGLAVPYVQTSQCRMLLTFRDKDRTFSSLGLAARSYASRLLGWRGWQDFLQTLTTVELTPLPCGP
jgi:hypothetical protein